ncbi:CAP domain-containing protein [Albibacillus kandeliae]|uniref:CAP domain-containing protein n=1 Tax=Albibacillus kandeliae TaxID=2174228 RepID=UPI001E3CBA9E|nr:CAP domain-containing protein [Albibacillus kandeliae]
MRAVLAGLLLTLASHAGAAPVPEAAELLNRIRAAANVGPVAWSPGLAQAAQAHGDDLSRSGRFSHGGTDGSSVGARVRRTGYGFCFVAENIAKGQDSLAEVLQAWAHSAPHLHNMLDPRATEAAVAHAPGDVWVMVLARPGC